MQFHDYSTLYDVSRRLGKQFGKKMPETITDYYRTFKLTSIHDIQASRTHSQHKDAVAALNQCLAETDYIENDRPYYIVYPTITKYLINLKEEKVPANLIKLPHRAITFRFADTETAFDFQDKGKTYKLRTVFATYTQQEEIRRIDNGQPINHDIMILWIDVGETHQATINNQTLDLPILTYKILHLNTPDKTLKDTIEESKGEVEGLRIPEEILTNIIRCIASCCLISKNMDDGLIEPDVLTADRDKYHETHDPKYIEKAKRKGKNGFLIGASLTINPHWRSGSPLALYWTGPGRTTPIYRPRKGALIHRKKIQELPTGYKGEPTQ